MTEGKVAQDLQKDAQRHRRDAETVISDRSHGYEPRDDDRDGRGIGEVGIDALHGTEPEESDEEEGDATELEQPRIDMFSIVLVFAYTLAQQ